jgi:hypothetical protein
MIGASYTDGVFMSGHEPEQHQKRERKEYFSSGGWLPTNKWAWITLAIFILVCVILEFIGVL